jgi:S1-C subfamily serine protease
MGKASSTIHIGVHGFLGVALAEPSTSGYGRRFGGYAEDPSAQDGTAAEVTIGGVVASSPADDAGLQAGDVITGLDGKAIDSATTLNSIMATTRPGQKVTLGWTDAAGQAHSASVTLGTAAAD